MYTVYETAIAADEQSKVKQLSGGQDLQSVAKALYYAFDPDNINTAAANEKSTSPDITDEEAKNKAEEKLQNEATKPFNGVLNQFLVNARKAHDQYIAENLDSITRSEWASDSEKNCEAYINDFENWIRSNKDKIEPLKIYFEQPHRRREVTLEMICDFIKLMESASKPFGVEALWSAYHRLGRTEKPLFDGSREAAALSLIRYVSGVDRSLVSFSTTVDTNYKAWVFKWNNAHPGNKLTDEDAEFMRHVRDHYKTNLHIDKEDFELIPFNEYGGYFRLKRIFGSETKAVLDDLNETLAA
jgi:type I restriction enzyme R subunit